MIKTKFFCFSLILINALFAEEVIVNAPFNTQEGQDLYITGSTKKLCNWRPNCIKLKSVSPGVYRYKSDGSEVPYKFKITRGSWKTESANELGHADQNFHVGIPNELKILSLKNWKDLGALKRVGAFTVIKDFNSHILANKREIIVRLPLSYGKDSQKKYPVIYMHDGQNLFDPKTSTFGTDWAVDDVLLKLEKKGEIREAIVVGIHHLDRRKEFNYFDKGEKYAKFIVEELKPFIDSFFQTLKDRENTFIMGSSYGAMISFTTAWKHSDVFSKAACLSLTAHSLDEMLFSFIAKFKLPKVLPDYYIDHGAIGNDSKYPAYVSRFYNHLLNKGYEKNKISYLHFPYADHTEEDWARRVNIPLKFFLKK